MTQAACHLILHYSTARLCWKTIKSLRRSQSHRRHDNTYSVSTENANIRINNDASSQVEFEILQGWTLLALHTLFVSTGMEYAVRFIVPFYYHFKMMMLIAFTVPSWAILQSYWRDESDDSSKGYSLSPLIPFCFNNILVPGVHKIHEMMDHDPRGWFLYVIAMAPLLILDFVFLPGVLLLEKEKESIRNARFVEKNKPAPRIKTPPRRAFPPPISNDSTPVRDSTKLSSVPEEVPREDDATPTPRREMSQEDSSSRSKKGLSFAQPPLSNNLNGFSPLAKSRITSSALRLRQFSRDHNVPSLIRPHSESKEDHDHLRQERDENLTLPSIRRRNQAFNNTFKTSGPTPTKLADHMDIDSSDDDSDEEYIPTPKPQRRRKKPERLSFGDHFREIVTGDASIRVRDHLFDLELPAVPSPSPRRQRGGNSFGSRSSPGFTNSNNKTGMALSPNVTTRRRSSRLAKRNGTQYYKMQD